MFSHTIFQAHNSTLVSVEKDFNGVGSWNFSDEDKDLIPLFIAFIESLNIKRKEDESKREARPSF